jgi:ADP-ribose pyrophosphatase
VKQFRYGLDAFSLEIPGGVIEPKEDPVAAGVRELREETGYVGTSARLLGTVHPNPAFISNSCHLLLVENVTLAGAVQWDHDEEIEVSTAPADEVFRWARTGRITHGLVLDALWFFEPIWVEMRARLGGQKS